MRSPSCDHPLMLALTPRSFGPVTVTLSIRLIFVGALAVATAYLATFAGPLALAPWMLAAGSTLILTGLGLLGVGPGRPRLTGAVLVACALTFAGFAVALLQSAPTADGPLWLGLPRATALMLVITGAVPLVLLPIAYGLWFDREVMDDA